MTKKLFQDDSYAEKFEAIVVRKLQFDGNPAVVLDQTLFYPKSGGQLHDTGYINATPVKNVFEKDGVIFHILEKEIDTYNIQGTIDLERRFDNMQQHTGQHILSACILRTIGARTISIALGNEKSTIDIKKDSFDFEEADQTEQECMGWIGRNVSVLTLYPTTEELANMNLRKQPENFEDKKIRIIHIDGLDHSACGGTHTAKSGEVGIIKILRWEKMRNNIRIEFICGNRALKDYQSKTRITNSVKNRLSTVESKIDESVQILMDLNKSLHKEIVSVKKNLFELISKDIFETGEKIGDCRIITYNDSEGNIDDLKILSKQVQKHGDFVFLATDEGDKPSFFVSCSDSVNLDLMGLLNSLKEKYEILGGGNQYTVQGKIVNRNDKYEFIDSFKKVVCENLNNDAK